MDENKVRENQDVVEQTNFVNDDITRNRCDVAALFIVGLIRPTVPEAIDEMSARFIRTFA